MLQQNISKVKKMFSGRKLVIATKHQKENVIAPLFEKDLGVICFTSENFDTDSLGTFSGEIERTDDPLTTLRKKCLEAMESNDCDLGIASEGSFGAHPTAFFIPADDELVIFIDKKNSIEIVAREVSTLTNFNGENVTSEKQLLQFAEKVGFPSHGLILRKSQTHNSSIIKGITDWDSLKKHFHQIRSHYGDVFVETDMRAMYNPSRMQVIAIASRKLLDKIFSCCPKCDMPGFNITEAKRGLPCEWCGAPTSSILSYIYSCTHCSYIEEKLYPDNKKHSDPMYCDYCNP